MKTLPLLKNQQLTRYTFFRKIVYFGLFCITALKSTTYKIDHQLHRYTDFLVAGWLFLASALARFRNHDGHLGISASHCDTIGA